jgi:hypothetical protein
MQLRSKVMAPAATGEFSSKDGPPALGLVALGLFVLAVGSLVYLSDRDSARALWIPAVPALAGHPLFGAAGAWLPSLAHAFAFSLFTATALPLRLAWRYGACGAWFAIHAAFEWGQHPAISPALAANIERHLGSLPGSRSLAGYFVHGVFDRGDIAAAATGALAAAVVLRLAHRSSETLHAG